MYLRNLYFKDLDVLRQFSQSVNLNLLLKYVENIDQAQDAENAFKKIQKKLNKILPPSGGGKFFDKDYPDGALSFDVVLSKNERIVLKNFSENIELESLVDHFHDTSLANNAMRTMQAIFDALIFGDMFDDEGNLKI